MFYPQMNEAANWASKAVEFDHQGKLDAAIYYYSVRR